MFALDEGVGYVGSLAPSFPAYFECHPLQLVTALKRAGFAYVEETVSVLPTLITMRREAGDARRQPLLGESCPRVLKMIEEEFPHLRSHVPALPSPMELHGSVLRRKYGACVKTVFCSPCTAKKRENAAKGAMDHVLTFAELEALLGAAGVPELSRLPKTPFDSLGVMEEARLGVLISDVDGEEECRAYLREYPQGAPPYTEILFCRGGCAAAADKKGRCEMSVSERICLAWEVV